MPTAPDYVERALVLLPCFGILFFIEFVAFFFLRQYRSAMDEFRLLRRHSPQPGGNLIILKNVRRGWRACRPVRTVAEQLAILLNGSRTPASAK